MSELQKFIRQFFFDNNWSKECDFNALPPNKIKQIVKSFSHIDIKSKLAILLSINSPSKRPTEETLVDFNQILNQALDDSNNLVRSIAGIIYLQLGTNNLKFDISNEHDAFQKNLQKLLKRPNLSNDSHVMLLAGFITTDNNNSIKNNDTIGFKLKEKPFSVSLKDSYLEKLQEECLRKRVHVPIPGRSFNRNDDKMDFDTKSPNVFIRKRPAETVKPQINDSSKTPLSSFGRMDSNELKDKLQNSSNRVTPINRSQINSNKPGIKMLEFDDLPAYGPKAKQLRKEQAFKEREQKKKEKEEKIREIKAAKEAAKIANLNEKIILSPPVGENSLQAEPAQSSLDVSTTQKVSLVIQSSVNATPSNLSQQIVNQTQKVMPFNYQVPSNASLYFNSNPGSIRYTRMNASSDEDDDSDEDCTPQYSTFQVNKLSTTSNFMQPTITKPQFASVLRPSTVTSNTIRSNASFPVRNIGPSTSGTPVIMKLVQQPQKNSFGSTIPQRLILMNPSTTQLTRTIRPEANQEPQIRPVLATNSPQKLGTRFVLLSNGPQSTSAGTPQQRFIVARPASSIRPIVLSSNPNNFGSPQTPVFMSCTSGFSTSQGATNRYLPRAQAPALSMPRTQQQPFRIQDDLSLTSDQASRVEGLFHDANRVSRPEMAVIVSFMAGVRDNPTPEVGNQLRIRLSEYREQIREASTNQLVDVVCDTYLHLDYATGLCEQMRTYRREPPEVLAQLSYPPAPQNSQQMETIPQSTFSRS